jgi:hypothetical protein
LDCRGLKGEKGNVLNNLQGESYEEIDTVSTIFRKTMQIGAFGENARLQSVIIDVVSLDNVV